MKCKFLMVYAHLYRVSLTDVTDSLFLFQVIPIFTLEEIKG